MPDTNVYSIDTGVGGNPLRGNYFDMNRDHLDGNLYKMHIGGDIQNIPTTTMLIKPESERPKPKKPATAAAGEKKNADGKGKEEEL